LQGAMPGVEIHAQALENLVSGRLVRRLPWAQTIEPLLTLVVGLALIFALPAASVVACGGATQWTPTRPQQQRTPQRSAPQVAHKNLMVRVIIDWLPSRATALTSSSRTRNDHAVAPRSVSPAQLGVCLVGRCPRQCIRAETRTRKREIARHSLALRWGLECMA